MFKVGDKVKVLPNGKTRSAVDLSGLICTVSEVLLFTSDKGYVHLEEEVYVNSGLWFDEIELVKENMTELEQLVKQTNDGWEASFKLRKYKDKLEFMPSNLEEWGNWTSSYGLKPTKCRIKLKPSFEPFGVGFSWLVKLQGDTVHIGCKEFNASILKAALSLLNKSGGVHSDFTCNRNGPQIYDKKEDKFYGIYWKESEKIVAALEQAGVK